MSLSLRLCLTTIFALLAFLSSSVASSAQSAGISISTAEQLKAEFDAVPCRNEDRLDATRALFEKMGAPASDISIDKYKNVENLVVSIKGASQEKIVIGAHYDKATAGCGVIDNWTGVVAMAHLYKSLKNVPLKKTILFVAFGKEENGLAGSRAMVKALGKEQLTQYCEMINIDSLGLAAPQVAESMSSKKLSELTASLAEEMKIPFGRASLKDYVSDSTSFIEKKIPALTIHGLTIEGLSIINSRDDQLSKLHPVSVYLGYRLALALVVRLDGSACGEYR